MKVNSHECSPSDLPDALDLSQLTEQYRHKVSLGTVPRRMALGIVIKNKLVNVHAINKG